MPHWKDAIARIDWHIVWHSWIYISRVCRHIVWHSWICDSGVCRHIVRHSRIGSSRVDRQEPSRQSCRGFQLLLHQFLICFQSKFLFTEFILLGLYKKNYKLLTDKCLGNPKKRQNVLSITKHACFPYTTYITISFIGILQNPR